MNTLWRHGKVFEIHVRTASIYCLNIQYIEAVRVRACVAMSSSKKGVESYLLTICYLTNDLRSDARKFAASGRCVYGVGRVWRIAGNIGGLVAPAISYGYKSQRKSGGGNHIPGWWI